MLCDAGNVYMADNFAEARSESNKACCYAGTARLGSGLQRWSSVQKGQGILPVEKPDAKQEDHRAEDSSGDSSSPTFQCNGVTLGDRSQAPGALWVYKAVSLV